MTDVKSDDAEAQGVEEITREECDEEVREEERGDGEMTDENANGTTRRIQRGRAISRV
jgi:hypothetical protein